MIAYRLSRGDKKKDNADAPDGEPSLELKDSEVQSRARRFSASG
jgi:hypothetical protein